MASASIASICVPTFFSLGLAAGGVLTKFIHRFPYGVGMGHRSECPSCGGGISRLDATPVASWFFLGGKCRACKAPIPWRYPVVEAITGLAWGIEGWRLSGMPGGGATFFIVVLDLAFVSSLIATAVIDWDCLIILDEISLGGAAVALAAASFLPWLHHAESPASFAAFSPELYLLFGGWPAWARSLGASFAGLAAGAALSLAVYWFGNLVFGKRIEAAQAEDPEIDSAFGLGDVKLMAFLGAYLGWWAVFVIFFIAAITGAAGGIALRLASGDPAGETGPAGLRNRWRSGESFLPFGPFLALGAYCVMIAR